MTAEITYIAVYLLGVSVGAIFAIVAKGIKYEDLWLQKRGDSYQDNREISSKQHTHTGLSSHLNFEILKK